MKKQKLNFMWAVLALFLAAFSSCSKDDTEYEMSDLSLKASTVYEVDSMYISRDPGSSYILYGLDLITDDNDSIQTITGSITTGSYSTLPVIYYNEKVYPSLGGTGVGCPALFLGQGVTGYQTTLTGYDALVNLSSASGTLESELSVTLPIDIDSLRYSDDTLIKTDVKSFYNDQGNFLIGNAMQLVDSDDDQPVYVINFTSGAYDYTYAFMVKRFTNGDTKNTGDPATDKMYMTVAYKLLSKDATQIEE